MSLTFRLARREDVAAVVALMADDRLGSQRETTALAPYLAAFDAMLAEGANHLYLAELDGEIVATYQITFIMGLSRRASRRAQVESVRIASFCRNRGFGAALMADAEARARAAGCSLIQLTTDRTRSDAHRFYDRLGFTPSHIGYKKQL